MSPISTGDAPMNDVSTKKLEDLTSEEMTSKDYYFDSYAHFGIHEVSSNFNRCNSSTTNNKSALEIVFESFVI